ncbi:MAG: YkgJ family cysteine cluster protein [Verrucomicrobiota bacterium]
MTELCGQCGLCCNGGLFADVRLRSAVTAWKLRQLGFPASRHGKTWRLPQPCPAFDGRWCRCYADRPGRCRAFECRLLLNVRSGELSPAQALQRIRQARRLMAAVERRLRQLGATETAQPLSQRYQAMLAQPWDFSQSAAAVRCRNHLWSACQKLEEFLAHEFR